MPTVARLLIVNSLTFLGMLLLVFNASGQSAGEHYSSDSINRLNEISRKLLDRVPDSALRYSEQALEAAEQANFKQGMAEAMSNLGFYYLDRAEFTTAYEYFNKVSTIMRDMQDTVGMAESMRNLGAVYRQRGLYVEAKEYFEEALRLALIGGNVPQQVKIYKDLGGINYYLKNYKSALYNFENSLELVDQHKERTTYAAILNNIGVVYKAWKQYDSALAYLLKAYTMLEDQGNVRDLSANLMNIGEIYDAKGQAGKAEEYFFRALEAAKEVRNIQRLTEAYEYLADFYAKEDNFVEAYKYQKLYSQYSDTVYNSEVDARMAEMAKKLEIERKERAFSQLIQDKELELLNKQNEIKELEIFRKTNLVYLAILGIIVIGAVAFILYRSYQVKNSQNNRLALQNNLLHEMNLKLQNSEKRQKELNDTKDKFFGILAHDLRSPLTSLRGFVQVLHLDYHKFTPEEVTRLTGQIERSLQSLTSLLDNLLQWATSQTGVIEFKPKNLNLHNLANESQELLEGVASGKRVMLENLVQPDTKIYADEQMIKLILRNLISNSIKFTPAGGQVSVSAWEDDEFTNLVISDTGRGMDSITVEAIRKQTAIRSSRGTENEKGSGLGLVLIQDFVERHHAKLEVESEIGQGTVFTVIFPKKKRSRELSSTKEGAIT
jgi:signal transduction histidine kinase